MMCVIECKFYFLSIYGLFWCRRTLLRMTASIGTHAHTLSRTDTHTFTRYETSGPVTFPSQRYLPENTRPFKEAHIRVSLRDSTI